MRNRIFASVVIGVTGALSLSAPTAVQASPLEVRNCGDYTVRLVEPSSDESRERALRATMREPSSDESNARREHQECVG
jgi:hypothetical protein